MQRVPKVRDGKTVGGGEMDMLKIARESGLAIVLDAKIGREEYTSVSGSMSALLRFGEAVRSASLRVHRRFRRSSHGERVMIARKRQPNGLGANVARKIRRPQMAVGRKLAFRTADARDTTSSRALLLAATDRQRPTAVPPARGSDTENEVPVSSDRASIVPR
jgi:hypothetical protein